MDKLTEQLCGWLSELCYESLPAAVVHEVKRRVLDSFGVAMAGWDADPCRISREQAMSVSVGQRGATVWGTRHKSTADLAAFANGTQTRYLDFNDTYLSLEPAHPSDNIPACIAAAEAGGADGRRLIAAIAAAYEIQCRLCDAGSIRARGWDHVVYGAVSMSAAAGWLWGLRGEQLAHAISLGTIANIAMRQTRVGQLSHWKGCAFANAARNGVFGVDLARRGMTGPENIFAGQMGLFKQVSGPLDICLAPDGDFMILKTYIKFWPAEYHAQSAIDAALRLRPKVGGVDNIERIDIDSFDAAVDIIGSEPEKWQPTSRETADHSMPYCVAAALTDGDVTLASFTDERIADPKLRGLVQRVSMHRDAELTRGYPAGIPNRLRIKLKNGVELVEQVHFPRGHAGNPMTDDEVVAKFTKASCERLPAAQREKLSSETWRLENLPDMVRLCELLALSAV